MSPDTNTIRVLAVDDHPMFREALTALLGSQPDMKVVAEAASGREAIQQFRTHQPDVTLMDLQMPGMNGLDAVAAIRKEFPGARIIILTTYENDVRDAMNRGARAYVLKNYLDKELFGTIRAVHAGK